MISPTGRGVRTWDDFGSGYFGVGRGGDFHDGVDFVGEPGQEIVAPYACKIVRVSIPSENSPFSGVAMDNGRLETRLWYLEPRSELIGTWVEEGEPIGRMQDVREKYGQNMTPHVHFRIVHCDPLYFMDDP